MGEVRDPVVESRGTENCSFARGDSSLEHPQHYVRRRLRFRASTRSERSTLNAKDRGKKDETTLEFGTKLEKPKGSLSCGPPSFYLALMFLEETSGFQTGTSQTSVLCILLSLFPAS